jgi:phthalate 4,5-dioxygenase reductase subunit
MPPDIAEAEMMPLLVERAEPIADGIHTFELRRRDGGELPEFTAGAHVSVRVPNGLLRKYSLCNDPLERDRYVIGVRREATGRGGSVSLVDEAKAGDELLVSPPRNDFKLVKSAGGYIFIAGGIGITPIMSMIRHLKSTGGGRFRLYYLTRSPETTAFRDELKGPEFRGQVTIHHDYGDLAKSYDLWPVFEQPKGQHIYCCGPRPLMEAVRDMTGHWSSSAVHFEAFNEPARSTAEDKSFRVRLAQSGDVIEVPVGTTILEALRAHGHEVPSSCESGTCDTCRTRLLEGEPDHRDLVLAEHEKSDFIMVCVSRAKSDEIVIDR